MVRATGPLTVSEAGVKLAFELGGSPVALKVTVPTGGFVARLAENTNEAALPAVAVALPLPEEVTATREMLKLSKARLLLKLASPIPLTARY